MRHKLFLFQLFWYLILAAQLRVMLNTEEEWIAGLHLENVVEYKEFLGSLCEILKRIGKYFYYVLVNYDTPSLIITKGCVRGQKNIAFRGKEQTYTNIK